jgi:peptidoglycan/LPS O-acetylase OafA/YrhL
MRDGLTYRPFLDGLRAVAVLAVVGYHLELSWFPGGFLGVDVFFVLSGYLITRLLLAEKSGAGRIDFLGFYARRLRRLLPALLVVLAAVVGAGGLVYAGELAYVIARDAAASLGYVANWAFIWSGQSYFESFGDPSPLRHMWSLAVEEQFYMVWPLAVLLLPTTRRRGIAGVAVLVAASALAMAWLYDPEQPSRAYYGTDARIHEPLIGAIAALVWVRWRDRLAVLRHAAVPCAAAMVAFMVLLADDAAIYYRGGSVLFSLIVALLILAVETDRERLIAPGLSSLPFVWIGKISYGMYLWHWPIIIALSPIAVGGPAPRAGIVIGLTIAISAASYHLIERPIRHARTLLGRPFTARRAVVAGFAAIAIMALPIGLRLHGSDKPAWAGREVTVSGTGAYRIALLGDSVMRSTLPGWQQLAEERGWTIIDGSLGGCSLAGGIQLKRGKVARSAKGCLRDRPLTLDRVAAERPDVLVWQSQNETASLLDPATEQPVEFGTTAHDRMIEKGWEEVLARFPGVPVVVVAMVHPGARRSRGCADEPHNCADDGSNGMVDHYNELQRRFVASHPGMHWIPLAPVVCPSGPPCPEYIGELRVRHDGYHYTEPAAALVVRAIADQLPR